MLTDLRVDAVARGWYRLAVVCTSFDNRYQTREIFDRMNGAPFN